MKALVTGCAGFIGGKVCEFLLQDGHTVIGIDNLNDAYGVPLKEWRLSRLKGESGFTFQQLDITDDQALAKVFRNGSFESVINLAARAGVRQSLEDPCLYYRTNVIGTLNLLEHCRATGVGKFVLASTSSVYGEGERPFRETAPTDCPLSPYAASKKASEVACYTYHRLYGIDMTVLRYFTVYGPAGRPDMSIFRFTCRIAEGESLDLYGDGSQQRDFTYVDDIARGTLGALRPLGYEVINLGSDRPVSLRDVIGQIEEYLGKEACISTYPHHQADVWSTWADITKAKEFLDWEPQVTFEEGLSRTVEWYTRNRDLAKNLV